MKNKLWIIALVTAILFCFIACDNGNNGGDSELTGTVTISPTGNVTTGTELSATYSGTETVSYQWKKDGSNVGTASTTKPNTFTPTQAGSYTVTVSATGYKSKTSAAVNVTGASIPELPGNVTISPSTDVTTGTELSATYSGTETVSYQWKKDGNNVGTASTTKPNTFTPTQAGSYTVTVSAEGYSSKTSAAVAVTVPPVSVLIGTPTITGTLFDGDTLTANTTGLNGSGTYSYEWKRGDTADAVNTAITDANEETYTLTLADIDKYIAVTITNSGNQGSVTSAAVGPVIDASAEITAIGADLAAKLSWLKTNTQSNRSYLVTVDKNESLDGATDSSTTRDNRLSYTGKNNITIRLTGTGGIKTISLKTFAGSLFLVESGVTLILDRDITLQKGSTANSFPLVKVNSGGILEMKDGAKITGNTIAGSASSYGGGVYINSNATFIMSGGEISANSAATGGGVFLNNNATFTMNGGKISGNSAPDSNGGGGGGVYMNTNVTFTMTSGEITTNDSPMGGGVSNGQGIFIMEGGKISSNTAQFGGGVAMSSSGTFTMSGGEISRNTASGSSSGGGGVYVGSNGGTFTMTDGEISGNNTASGSGGGVYVGSSGTFTMTGGKISGNTASGSLVYGGGVYVGYLSTPGIFTKTGGTITGYSDDTVNGNVVKNASNVVQTDRGHAVRGSISLGVSYRRENTAGPTVNLDSNKSGAPGGWE
ncbi:beta strand repeat-containing protein [Treponema sp. R80B11-R83G3]